MACLRPLRSREWDVVRNAIVASYLSTRTCQASHSTNYHDERSSLSPFFPTYPIVGAEFIGSLSQSSILLNPDSFITIQSISYRYTRITTSRYDPCFPCPDQNSESSKSQSIDLTAEKADEKAPRCRNIQHNESLSKETRYQKTVSVALNLFEDSRCAAAIYYTALAALRQYDHLYSGSWRYSKYLAIAIRVMGYLYIGL